MRSRLNQLARGIVAYEAPEVLVVPKEVRESILPGKVFSFELKVSSEKLSSLHLFFYSLNPRVEVVRQQTFGKEISVGLEISTVGLSVGDELKGQIDIVYNGGELAVPYEFRIAMALNGRVYDFRTAEEFASYALEEPDDAAGIFGRREFISMPFLSDILMRNRYLTFRNASSDDAGLSAFLTALGKPVPKFRNPRDLYTAGRQTAKRRPAGDDTEKNTAKLFRLFLLYDRILRGGALCPSGTDLDLEFTKLVEAEPEDTMMRLAAAYYFMNSGNEKRAIEMLIVIQEQIKRERNEKRGNYVLFTYLTGLIRNDEEYIKAAKEYAHRLYFENVGAPLYAYLEYRLNVLDQVPDSDCYQFLLNLSRRGVKSTFFLQELCLLFQRDTGFVGKLNEFEIRSLLFGLRRGLLDQQMLFDLLSCEITDRDLVGLYLLVLKCGYHKFGNPELLQAICTIFVNESAFGPKYFPWYRRAVGNGMFVKGLNELYLQSVPKDYDAPLPRNIILYFGYGRAPEHMSYDTLFMNVITFYSGDAEIRKLYSSRIREYALRKMKNEEYSEPMIPIFRSVLTEENLDQDTAAPMLKMLYLRRITTSIRGPRKLIVHYPQLRQEAVYHMKNRTILVPVFSDEVIYAVEDTAGFRMADPKLTSELLFDYEELRAKCLLYVKNSVFTLLSGLDPVLREGITNDREEAVAKAVIRDQNLDEYFRAYLYAELAAYALAAGKNSEDFSTFLLDADLAEMTKQGRADVMEALISSGFVDSALKRGKMTGFEPLSEKQKSMLLRPILTRQGDAEDDDLVYLCYTLYKKGKADNRALEYLGSCLNSGTEDMRTVLRSLREKHIPTGDMVIRTMTQMIYTNQLKGIETCFDWFMSEAYWDDELFRAYLVLRSDGYLLKKHKLTDAESEALRTHTKELSMVSVLALLTWYAETDRGITEDDRRNVAYLLRRALDEGMVLACYSELGKRFRLPEELEGRVFLEFRGDHVSSAAVVGTVFPGRRFFQRSLSHMYGPIYAKSVVLYPAEWINYYYSVQYEDGRTEETEGPVVTLQNTDFSAGSRMEDADKLSACVEKKPLSEGEAEIRRILLKDGMIEDIFKQ